MNEGTVVPLSSRRMGRKRENLFLKVVVIALVLAGTVFITWECLVAAVSKVHFLSYQEVCLTTPLEGWLVKEEEVLRSPVSGEIHFIVPDGKRLEVGAGAAQVITAGEGSGKAALNIFTPVAGVFCTHLDGLESILSPENMNVLDLTKLEKTVNKAISEGVRVEKGQPVFKLIDNLSPIYFYAVVSKNNFSSDLADKTGWLQATWENQTFKIKLDKIVDKGDRWECIFLLNIYPEDIIHYRKIRLNVTTNKLNGLLVSHRAVVYRNGEPGLYLAVKKKACWVPVKIEGELDGKVAVSGQGIGDYTRYVSNPVLVREGWPVE